MSSLLYRIGRACYRHRGRVLALWLVVLAVLGLGTALGRGTFDDAFRIPGASSQKALDQLRMTFPEAADASAQLLVIAPEGASLRDKALRDKVEQGFAEIEALPFVKGVQSPYNKHIKGKITPDGHGALAAIRVSGTISTFPDSQREELLRAAERMAQLIPGSEVHLGGEVYSVHLPKLSVVETIGLAVALVVLLVVLGSVIAALMPVGTAVLGVGLIVTVTMLSANVVSINSTTLILAIMLALAVGIDYALFIVSRHRDQLAAGLEVEESAARAVATAGSAVVFAGLTVVIALVGLSLAGIPFLGIMGTFAAVGVAIEVLLALTLLPAFLGFAGGRLRPRAPRRSRSARAVAPVEAAADEAAPPATPDEDGAATPTGLHGAAASASGPSRWWVNVVTKFPVLTIVLVVAVLGALAYPAKDLALALPNSGRSLPGSIDRVTFDLISREFGIGHNGPLIITGTIVESTDPLGIMDGLRDDILTIPGVEAVTVATPNENADTGLIQIVPTTGPDDPATAELVHRLRARHDAWLSEWGIDTSVTGSTAVQIDVTQRLSDALLPFGIFVMGLSFVLLMLVFRSIWVPLKAALGYLLSVAGAFGATALVFNLGWFKEVINLHETQPVISFLPIILMGILFGLAMDYEVFLVSRMREEYVHGNTTTWVEDGFVHSAKVVVAAAVIMFAVFAFFVPAGEGLIKPIAFSLAVGVALDAFLIRMTLGPAVMKLLGARSWWLPRWIERRLPVMDVEGETLAHQLSLADWPAADGQLVHAEGLSAAGQFEGVDVSVAPGEVLLVEGDATARRALLLALGGRFVPESGEVKVAGLVLPEQASQVRRAVAYASPSVREPLKTFTGPVLVVDNADQFSGPPRRRLAHALAAVAASSGRAAIVAHAPGADLSDVLPGPARVLRLEKEAVHV